MRFITIRLEDELHRRLRLRAAGAHLSLSAFLRPLIEDAAYPGGRYVYTAQDELLGVALQSFAILAELAGAQSPEVLARGMSKARNLLRDRGLLPGDDDELTEPNPFGRGRGEVGR